MMNTKTKLREKTTSLLLVLCMVLALMAVALLALPVPVRAETPAELVTILNAIPGLTASVDGGDPNVVNVTGTATLSDRIDLKLNPGVTVKWGASLTSSATPALDITSYNMATFELVGGGSIVSSSRNYAISASNLHLIINGGSITASEGTAIQSFGNASVSVNSGSITAGYHAFVTGGNTGAVMAIYGGSVTANNNIYETLSPDARFLVAGGTHSGRVFMQGTGSKAYVLGGSLAAGAIMKTAGCTGYYTGSNNTAFVGGYTLGTSLFALDVPDLTLGSGPAYSYDGVTASTEEIVAQLPAGALDYSSITASAGATGMPYTQGGSFTFYASHHDAATTLSFSGTIPGTTLQLNNLVTQPFGININSSHEEITVRNVETDGAANTAATTTITLSLNNHTSSYFTIDDIIISGTGSCTKTSLNNMGLRLVLAVADVTPGDISVYVKGTVDEYFVGVPQTATLHQVAVPVNFLSATASNGVPHVADTTAIDLVFDTPIALTADDITLSDVTGRAAKGMLSGGGTNYTLIVYTELQGDIEVGVASPLGYSVQGGPHTVSICRTATPQPFVPEALYNTGGDVDVSIVSRFLPANVPIESYFDAACTLPAGVVGNATGDSGLVTAKLSFPANNTQQDQEYYLAATFGNDKLLLGSIIVSYQSAPVSSSSSTSTSTSSSAISSSASSASTSTAVTTSTSTATAAPASPQTGDNSRLPLWAALGTMALALAGFSVLAIRRNPKWQKVK